MGTQILIPSSSSNLVYVQTVQSGNITGVTPTSLITSGIGSVTIPKKTFQIGSTYRFIMGGIGDVNGVAGQNIKFDIGLSTMAFATLTYPSPATTANSYQLECTFTVTSIGAAGIAALTGVILFSSVSNTIGTSPSQSGKVIVSTGTFDTTVDNTLYINGYFSTALGTNKITSGLLILEKLK